MNNKIIFLYAVALLSGTPALAQSLVYKPFVGTPNELSEYAYMENYAGVIQLADLMQYRYRPNDREAYERLRALLRTDENSSDYIVNRFLEKYPTTLHRQSLMLMLGNLYLERNDFDRAEYVFRDINPNGLNADEKTQWYVQWAYALMKHYKVVPGKTPVQSEPLRQVRNLLQLATAGSGIWGAYSLLYLSALDLYEGNPNRALSILKNTTWPDALLPEAGLYEVLATNGMGQYRKGVRLAEQLKTRYPELARHKAFHSSVGQAYFQLHEYKKAHDSLMPLFLSSHSGDLQAPDAFALGVSAYRLGLHDKAAIALATAASGGEKWSAVSNLYRGLSLWEMGRGAESITVLESVVSQANAPQEMREEALYNMAIVQRKSGVNNFGQAVKTAERFLNEYEQSPKREVMAEMLTEAFLTGKDYHSSLASIRRINHPTPDIQEAQQYVLNRLAAGEKEPAKQLAYLREAISLPGRNAHYAEAMLRRADYYLKSDDYEQSAADATRYIEWAKFNHRSAPEAQYILGYSHFNRQRYDAAYQAFSESVITVDQKDKIYPDALCRMADCQYVQRNLDDAARLYRRANDAMSGGMPDALIRLADIYNLRKDYLAQMAVIDELLNNHSDTPYAAEALYQKGRAAVMNKQSEQEAIQTFSRLSNEYPDTKWARLGGIDLALLYYNQGKTDLAIRTYKQLISRYKHTEEASSALSDLRSICLEQDRIQEYTDFVSSLGSGFTPTAAETAHLRFLAAESYYRKQSGQAENVLKSYLSEFPDGADSYQAMRYLAAIYEHNRNLEQAVDLYERLGKSGVDDEFRVEALLKYGKLNEEIPNFQAAYQAYETLSALKLDPTIRTEALSGKVRTAFAIERYDQVISGATEYIGGKNTDDNIRRKMLLMRARAHEAQNGIQRALQDYKQARGETDSDFGAEIAVRESELLFKSGKSEEAKTQVEKIINKGLSEQYWLARAFILLSDCYTVEGNSYTARQYLESLKQNYGGKNAEIDSEITKRLTKE